jgi:Mg2+ and Co2+ transporter CorA
MSSQDGASSFSRPTILALANFAQMFNASSVKEASKSTELATISTEIAGTSIRQNQYIFVFTVTTVIFLPLGFVTASIPISRIATF